MDLKKIQADLILAMKSGDETRKSALRLLIAELKNEAIAKKSDLTDGDIVSVISRQIKRLKEGIEEFKKAKRDDLSKSASEELQIVEAYMPAQMSDKDLKEIVKKVINELKIESARDAGQAMSVLMKELKGKADGSRVRETLTQMLNQ